MASIFESKYQICIVKQRVMELTTGGGGILLLWGDVGRALMTVDRQGYECMGDRGGAIWRG
jgi:hypothetical protein